MDTNIKLTAFTASELDQFFSGKKPERNVGLLSKQTQLVAREDFIDTNIKRITVNN
jgi:hypothetical protein